MWIAEIWTEERVSGFASLSFPYIRPISNLEMFAEWKINADKCFDIDRMIRWELICLRWHHENWKKRQTFHFSLMASFYANKMGKNWWKICLILVVGWRENEKIFLSSTRSICNPHFTINSSQWMKIVVHSLQLNWKIGFNERKNVFNEFSLIRELCVERVKIQQL